MIQRIQSVLLLVAAICMTVMIFVPLWSKQNVETGELAELTALYLTYTKQSQTVSEQNTMYVAGLAFLSVALAFTSIFSYKNRMLQVKLNLGNTILMTLTLAVSTFLLLQAEKLFPDPSQGSFGIGFFLIIIALICNFVANRFIWKDEKLVKNSFDRIR